ncbi:hypothetical protein BH10BAC4_BH10BAC4_23180 [soil metagenome]
MTEDEVDQHETEKYTVQSAPKTTNKLKKISKKLVLSILIPSAISCITIIALVFLVPKPISVASQELADNSNQTKNNIATSDNRTTNVESEIDTTKQYGDKYADGLLPVGDNKYSTTTATKGSIFLCHAPNGGEGGAGTRGPWFTNNNTEYDINKKAKVSGNVTWDGQYAMTISGSKRVITTNDLPSLHTTGVFPIASKDAAYLYDRNPNSIKSQSLTYSLTASPTQLATPQCMGGESGIMTTGVALFNAFDAGGRDAGAWEVQDSCGGHPQKDGEYHYHTLSSCITDVSATKVIGYALDGYPITGPTVSKGNVMTTSDLDECHGIVSAIELDGKTVTSYHYVMTQDFPYSVSCFRASAPQTTGPH